MTELYRYFDAEDRLLYIGVSSSVIQRNANHRSASGWHRLCTKITIERYDTREDAFRAEKQAIKNEKPLHNIMHADVSKKKRPGPIMNSNETAALLGINRKALWALMKSGECPVPCLPGIEPPMWRRVDVEAFVGVGL